MGSPAKSKLCASALVKSVMVALVLALTLGPVCLIQAQQCQESAQSQIQTALDRTTNLILLREVVDDYGEEGKGILVQIAGDETQPANRRGRAIQLLGEHRSDAGEKLLITMFNDPKRICAAIPSLQHYRNPQLIPRFIALLDDHRNCGIETRYDVGGSGKERTTEVFLSDEIVEALERLTGKRLEKERDLFLIGHRATQPWIDWWNENRAAFETSPSSLLAPEPTGGNNHYPCSVQKIAVSPDGKTAVSAGKNYGPWIRAWDISGRRQIWSVPNVRDEDAQSATFSPDGRMVAIGTSNGALKVFNGATGKRLRFLIFGRSIDSSAFSPDGAMLASASDDGSIQLFDTKTWCEAKHIDNADMTEGIAFSPDGSMLAAATFEKVRLWNVATGTEIRSFQVRPGQPPRFFADAGERDARLWRMAWQVAFSPDGKLLATGSSAAVELWDWTTGREVSSAKSNGEVESLHFSQDGRWIVWGNDRDEIVRWNPTTRKRSRIKNEFGLGDTAMTPDGKLILSPEAGTEIAIFDLEGRRKVGTLSCSKGN